MTRAKRPARHQPVLLALALMIVGCTSESQTLTTPDARQGEEDVADIPPIPDNADLIPGRYIVLGPGMPRPEHSMGWPEAVIVTVPGGWSNLSRQRGSGIYTGEQVKGARLYMGSVENVVADPCPPDVQTAFDIPADLLDPPVGPTIDALASAVASIAGIASTSPTNATLAGFEGIHMTLTIPPDGCPYFQLWVTPPTSGESWGHSTSRGWHHQLWILDVNGLLFVVDASYAREASAEVRAELLQMVNSIEIRP